MDNFFLRDCRGNRCSFGKPQRLAKRVKLGQLEWPAA
jgi:hypothetical protein